jgi:hypothetical protein
VEPNNSDTQGILERLEKLERQKRRLKLGAAVPVLILISLVLMAQTSSHKAVEANAFFLVDQDGTRRAELSMTHGVPGLTIYGTRKEKVWLAAGKNGSILSLEEPDGKASASLDVGGGSSLTLTDDKGTVALRVYKASPSLWMDGVDGTASLNTVGSGPALSLDGVKGQHSFLNPIGLMVRGERGGVAVLGVVKDAGPALAVTDSQGFRSVLGVTKTVSTGTGEQHQTSAAALTMFDKEGKVIWSAP